MRFRRNNGSPVSFFAFQDVITGVAGVMLIVMLLVVIGKRQLSGSSAEDAQNGVNTLQADLAQIEAELALTQQRVKELRAEAGKRGEAKENARRIHAQTLRNEELAEEFDKREKEARELQNALDAQKAELARLAPQAAEYLNLLNEERALKRAWRSARLQLAPESRREIFVLTLARSAWRWESRNTAPELLGGNDAANPTAAWRALEKHLQALDPQNALLIVAVRPSAGGFFAPLTSKIRTAAPDLAIALEPLASETEGGIKLE